MHRPPPEQPGAARSAQDGASDEPDQAAASVATRTVKGLLWAYGAYVGGRALVLVSTAILARLLSVSDFGVVALALVFMTFLYTVRDLGLTQALVTSSDEELAEHTQTVFVGTLAIGAALSLAAAAIGPLASGWFGHPELAAIIPVLAANFFLQALGATHDALARRALDFRARTVAEYADVVVRGTTGVVLALAGAGVWSLVIGYVVGTLSRDVALWATVPWRPSFSFPRRHLRRLVRFGGVLTVVDILAAVAHNADYLFVGRVLGSEELGLYTIAFRLPELLILNLAIVASAVLFPAYAALDPSRLQEGFRTSLSYIVLLVFPVAMGMVILARPAVLVLFGPKYEGSIEVMRLLVIFAVLATINIPAGTIYKVTGRGGILLFTALPYVVVLIVLLAFFTGDGILAVGTLVAINQGVSAVISLAIATHILGVGWGTIWRSVRAPLAATAVTGLALLPVAAFVGPPVLCLLAGGLVGTGVYLGAMLLFDRSMLLRLKAMVMPGGPAPAATA